MSDKYEDLTDRIAEDLPPMTGPDIATLRWLDEHPDQVPGRTITESIARDLRMIARHSDYAGFAGALSMRGITIVPDPEPTNAEKLKALYGQWLESDAPACRVSFHQFMDEAGVKAPGGDDEPDNHV